MNQLPRDLLESIFNFLDSASNLKLHQVCRKWRSCATGCGSLVFCKREHASGSTRQRVSDQKSSIQYGDVCFKGVWTEKVRGDEEGTEDPPGQMNQHSRKRTRGHLAEPNVMNSMVCHERFKPIDQTVIPGGVAFRSESSSCSKVVRSLDLESSSVGLLKNQIHGGKRLRLGRCKKLLTVVSLSSFQYLQRLCVRGCAKLECLFLPGCLVALDASACTRLRQIYMDNNKRSYTLQAVNLNGCRSLVSLEVHADLFQSHLVFQNVRELDLTSTSRLQPQIVAKCLQSTQHLVSLSIRYIATDAIFSALAESTSATETLQLVDTAFGRMTNDVSVEELVRKAPHLIRCNLRGCKQISAACYNRIPIELELRRTKTAGSALGGPATGARSKRKGDNLFFFAK